MNDFQKNKYVHLFQLSTLWFQQKKNYAIYFTIAQNIPYLNFLVFEGGGWNLKQGSKSPQKTKLPNLFSQTDTKEEHFCTLPMNKDWSLEFSGIHGLDNDW